MLTSLLLGQQLNMLNVWTQTIFCFPGYKGSVLSSDCGYGCWCYQWCFCMSIISLNARWRDDQAVAVAVVAISQTAYSFCWRQRVPNSEFRISRIPSSGMFLFCDAVKNCHFYSIWETEIPPWKSTTTVGLLVYRQKYIPVPCWQWTLTVKSETRALIQMERGMGGWWGNF